MAGPGIVANVAQRVRRHDPDEPPPGAGTALAAPRSGTAKTETAKTAEPPPPAKRVPKSRSHTAEKVVEPKAEAEAAAEPGVEAEAAAEPGVEAEPKAEAEAEPGVEAEPKAEAEAEPKAAAGEERVAEERDTLLAAMKAAESDSGSESDTAEFEPGEIRLYTDARSGIVVARSAKRSSSAATSLWQVSPRGTAPKFRGVGKVPAGELAIVCGTAQDAMYAIRDILGIRKDVRNPGQRLLTEVGGDALRQGAGTAFLDIPASLKGYPAIRITRTEQLSGQKQRSDVGVHVYESRDDVPLLSVGVVARCQLTLFEADGTAITGKSLNAIRSYVKRAGGKTISKADLRDYAEGEYDSQRRALEIQFVAPEVKLADGGVLEEVELDTVPDLRLQIVEDGLTKLGDTTVAGGAREELIKSTVADRSISELISFLRKFRTAARGKKANVKLSNMITYRT